MRGWPDSIKKVPKELKPYWSIRDELTIEDNILFKSNRVIIPQAMRKYVLEKVHLSHQGIEKTTHLAKDVVYGPGLLKQIEHIVQTCPTCLKFQSKQQKEPMISHPKPDRPWQIIGSDIFELNGKKYLLLVDYYSGYFEVDELTTTTSH